MIARATLLAGSTEDVARELESVAQLYLSLADTLEAAASGLDELAGAAANRSDDTMDDWISASVQWDGVLSADAAAGIQIGLRIAAHPAPETQALFETALGLLRQRATVEATALAKKRRLRLHPEFGTSVSSTPAAAAKAARDSIERLRAGARALPGRQPTDAVIRDLAELVRKESDDALGEVIRLIGGHSDREAPSPPLPLEWITSWSERLRLLEALDPPMRELIGNTERRALPELLDRYVSLAEAEGRTRLVEWLELQKRTVPTGLRPKERRDVPRLQEDRAAVLVKLQKLLPPTS